MAFTIDDTMLPARLTSHPMTDEEFAELCAEHPDLFLEMTAEGELIVMPPVHTLVGVRNAEITGQLGD
jgi:Uma2 family endonuclease